MRLKSFNKDQNNAKMRAGSCQKNMNKTYKRSSTNALLNKASLKWK